MAIGASAGGIEAITHLLQALPPDTGMAFVIVQHLSPTHDSMLASILGRATRMAVAEARDGTPVLPDHVYVIAPNSALAIRDGILEVSPRIEPRGQTRPIDDFMRSLAQDNGYRSIGVVLSGLANDGTLGLEEIKAAGGISFAQDATAQQASMPRSAIAADVVDFVLPPQEIARELASLARHPLVAPTAPEAPFEKDPAFRQVIDLLRDATGVDFSRYKRNTLQRRISRRMVLHKLEDLPEYVRLLQSDAEELEALYRDVLINVTSFFRDPEAYEALKSIAFAGLTEKRARQEALRVWSLGCSTGEEPYSIAMAYTEFCEASDRHVPLQVFATDLNALSIEMARAGVYPPSIAQEMSAERLRRFFTESDGDFRVAKPIRELCVFAAHNALSDPPFSRMDLIACRNLLIYLEPALQQRVIAMLHYALRPGGFLWLGGSETIGAYSDLFELADARSKLYRRKPTKHVPELAAPVAPGRPAPIAAPRPARPPRAREPAPDDALREADRMLLSRYAPPGVVVDDNLQVLQFRGDIGAYLSPAPGRADLGLLKMLREGLLVAVRAALDRSRRDRAPVREEGLRVRSNGGWREVDIIAMPVRAGDVPDAAYLVLFEEPLRRLEARAQNLVAEAQAAVDRIPAARDEISAKEIHRLTQELAATREYLQSVIEQQEAANEELQSANEEVQSSNEELATVNDELQSRNLELARSNGDLTNLLASVNMAIVMLGRDGRIRRFTPPAERILRLAEADVGRRLSDLTLGIDLPGLERMIAEAVDHGAAPDLEIRDRADRWYSLRVRPYRTSDDKIDGAVLMLVDIDELKRAEQSLRESEGRFELLADSAPVLIWVDDSRGCRFVNHAFESFVGQSEDDIRKGGLAAYVHPEEREQYEDAYAAATHEKRRFEMRLRVRRADGVHQWMKVLALPRSLEDGGPPGVVGCAVDVTDLAEAEAALRELDRGRNEFLAVLAHELRNPLSGVRNAAHLLAQPADAKLVQDARAIIERQIQRMVRLIDDLLDVSRITYGKIHLRKERLDLEAAARRAIEATELDRHQLGQVLETGIAPGPLNAMGDAVRIDQVLTNILGNASKFTPHGGRIWLTMEREPAPGGDGHVAAIRVRDNGSGIDPAMIPHVFELFVQGHDAEHSGPGIGLGLALAKRLVELHDGTIEARSDGPGKGSEFVVRLPLLA